MPSSETPTVTVLMSVHNGLPYVADAVSSVLAQTFADLEFLIVDDASTDGTGAYLRSLRDPRIRLLALAENRGLTPALNAGLRAARGEFIARQDADDLSAPTRLALQVAHLRAHPACAVVGAQARLVDARGRSQGRKDFPTSHRAICFAHLFDNALAHSAATFRRAAVLRAGGYDEAWPASQDYELWSRLSTHHELANLPQRLVTLRVLESSITRQHRQPELIRRVQAHHYAAHFGSAPAEADLDLIGLYRARVVPERLREFRALLEELLAVCEVRNPGSTSQSDFRRMLGRLHERVGYNLLTLSRAAGLGEILRALKIWPPALGTLPWLRIGALTLLGENVRRLHARITR